MTVPRILTIGVYGWAPSSFLRALGLADNAMVVDVRRHRGLRGQSYAWANATRLQELLRNADIGYYHEPRLAPTADVRAIQHRVDRAQGVAKRARRDLDMAFRSAYELQVLRDLDPLAMWVQLFASSHNPVLLCVEREPSACHRSLAAEWLAGASGAQVLHLTP